MLCPLIFVDAATDDVTKMSRPMILHQSLGRCCSVDIATDNLFVGAADGAATAVGVPSMLWLIVFCGA